MVVLKHLKKYCEYVEEEVNKLYKKDEHLIVILGLRL